MSKDVFLPRNLTGLRHVTRGRRAASRSCVGLIAILVGVASQAPVAVAQLPTLFPSATVPLNSEAADRARLRHILGRDSSPPPPIFLAHGRLRWRPVLPDIRATWNSKIPYSINDGAMWAGRGWNTSITTGATMQFAKADAALEVTVAPTFTYSENRAFDIFPGSAPGRSYYSSPWHLNSTIGSADLPLRFGNEPLHRVDWGESSISLRVRNAMLAATAAHEWWGPGIRNALILSDNAPGIPRLLAGTARPVRTRIGTLALEVESGVLTESAFFDTISTRNYSSFTAARLEYSPPGVDNLSFGLTRVIYKTRGNATPALLALRDLLRWKPMTTLGEPRQPADQLASVFARWVVPGSGFEAYAEFARQRLPTSVTDAFLTPYHNGGFTVGMQWALPVPKDGAWRLQAEATSVEQSTLSTTDTLTDFYTGRAAIHGYTQRGQIIGAAIGPGGSSQWLAVDRFQRVWHIGLVVDRIRWEENALTRQFAANFMRHDVSFLYGVRGAYRLPRTDVSVELLRAIRYNYLFQNPVNEPGGGGSIQVHNITFTMRLTPR